MRMLPETRIEATLSELLVKVLLCPRMLDSRLVDFQNLNAVTTDICAKNISISNFKNRSLPILPAPKVQKSYFGGPDYHIKAHRNCV